MTIRGFSLSVASAAFILAAAGGLQGCAGVGLTLFGAGAGVAAGTGVSHSLNGIAYKTFVQPMPHVERASIQALDRMSMDYEKVEDVENGRMIIASAEGRKIEIKLEKLTVTTTRMRVVAHQDVPLLRDQATATEIIYQTAAVIDEFAVAGEKPRAADLVSQ